jgi:serine/threonine protein kinase
MDLLGPSLVSVMHKLGINKFSVSTGLRIAWHVLHGIQDIHKKGYVHRDIKPSNIVLRSGNALAPVGIIDFGMARYYLEASTGEHSSAREDPGFRGTAMYASCNSHMHHELSRRDDLISWYYVVAELLTGSLPWKGLADHQALLAAKQSSTPVSLTKHICPEISDIWYLINGLEYHERPNYERIYELIEQAMNQRKISMDDSFDWERLKDWNEVTEGSGAAESEHKRLKRTARHDGTKSVSETEKHGEEVNGCCILV